MNAESTPSLPTVDRHITELILAEYNPRKMTPEDRKGLRDSLLRFGFVDPAIVNMHPDRRNIIIGGHQRITVWKELGHDTVPCVELSLSRDRERELNLRLNRNTGRWDYELLGKNFGRDELEDVGFDEAELEMAGFDDEPEVPTDADPEADRAEELNEKWKVKPGDMFRIGTHRLICGDSTNAETVGRVQGGMPPPLMMVTDQPYGVKYDASWRKTLGNSPNMATGKVLNDDRVDWQAAYELSRAQVAYVWHAGLYVAEVGRGLTDAGFSLRAQIIWVKSHFVLSRGDYHWGHETCLYAVRKGAPGKFCGGRAQSTKWADIPALLPAPDTLYAVRVDAETVYCFPSSCSTIWDFGNDDMVDGGHSTQKPLECMARPIRNHGADGDVVYEPFAGTGTTMVAAQNLGRVCLAVELNPAYCAVILERMSKAFTGIEIEKLFKSDEAAV